MKLTSSILFFLLSTATNAFAVTELEEKLSAQPGLMTLIENYSSEIGSECRFSDQTSYFYDSTDNVRSFVASYRCGEGQNYPFARVEGSILEDGKVSFFEISFIRR